MKVVNTSGARKTAIARVSAKAGTGKIRINGVPLEMYTPKYSRLRIQEALLLAPEVKVDLSIRVQGGGSASQADAIRLAIGRALVAFSDSEELRQRYLAYDRQLLVADVRRREAAKPNNNGKARAKRQKSYR